MPDLMLRITNAVRRRLKLLAGTKKPVDEVFTDIYKSNAWASDESVSGPGSDMADTAALRAVLPGLMRELGARSMLDAPCGDFNWMRTVDLPGVDYIGGDIVEDLVLTNQMKYGTDRPENQAKAPTNASRRFEVVNIVDSKIPKVDLIMCRDCLVHLPIEMCRKAIMNFKLSGSTWLLTTTFPAALGEAAGGAQRNKDILPGDWRPIDLQLAPFLFPEPSKLIDEKSRFNAAKRIGLWKLADIPEIG
jgi:hypothetical protein